MENLEALQQAMARNAQATQQLQGLDERYSRAEALRDRPMTQMDQYGQVSPLAVLADVIGKSRGRRDMRLLNPQREAARTQIAEGTSALEGDKLRRALAKEGRDVEAHDSSMLTQTLGRKKTKQDMEAGTKGERWVNKKDDKDLLTVVSKNGIPYTQNPETGAWDVPVDSDTYIPEGRYAGRGLSGYGNFRGKEFPTGYKKAFSDEATNVIQVDRLLGEFDPMYAQPTKLPTGFLNDLAVATSRQDLTKYLDSDLDADTKKAMLWWADWKMLYSLGKRHDLFGATLTNNELKSWADAEQMILGGDPEVLQERMAKLVGDYKEEVLGELNSQYKGTYLPQNRGYLGEKARQMGLHYDEDKELFSYDPAALDMSDVDMDDYMPNQTLTLPPNAPGTQAQWDALTDQQKYDYYQTQGVPLPDGF